MGQRRDFAAQAGRCSGSAPAPDAPHGALGRYVSSAAAIRCTPAHEAQLLYCGKEHACVSGAARPAKGQQGSSVAPVALLLLSRVGEYALMHVYPHHLNCSSLPTTTKSLEQRPYWQLSQLDPLAAVLQVLEAHGSALPILHALPPGPNMS